MDFGQLRRLKREFILDENDETPKKETPMSAYVSPSFQGLVPWLQSIRSMFCYVLRAWGHHYDDLDAWVTRVNKQKAKSSKAGHAARPVQIPPRPTFDNATLSNKVSCNLHSIFGAPPLQSLVLGFNFQ